MSKKPLVFRLFSTRNMAVLLAVILILCLIPMYAVGVYSHPSGDDYAYGLPAHEAWEGTRSLLTVVMASARNTVGTYSGWQGTFSAVFLMGLQPGFFGEQYYFLGVLFLLTTFLAASVWFIWVALVKTLHMDGWSALLAGSVFLLLCTQFMPMAFPAFYWYNGAIYYTFFYTLSLAYGALILQRWLHGKRGVASGILILLLSVVIGGGNYATVIVCIALLAGLLAFELAHKRFNWLLGVAWALLLTAFLVSYLAPGTAVRAAACDSIGFPRAVLVTFLYTGKFFSEHLSLPIVLATLLCLPVLAKTAARSSWSFRFPVLVTLGSFALMYIGLFPPVYAMGGGVPLRLLNILFYMAVALLFVNLYYYLGWLARALDRAEKGSLPARLRRALSPHLGWFYLVVGALTVISLCSVSSLERTSVQAAMDLVSGDAAQFDRETDERIAIVTGSQEADVAMPALSVWPETLCCSDLDSDPGNWMNQLFARYWKKDSVYTTAEPSDPAS